MTYGSQTLAGLEQLVYANPRNTGAVNNANNAGVVDPLRAKLAVQQDAETRYTRSTSTQGDLPQVYSFRQGVLSPPGVQNAQQQPAQTPRNADRFLLIDGAHASQAIQTSAQRSFPALSPLNSPSNALPFSLKSGPAVLEHKDPNAITSFKAVMENGESRNQRFRQIDLVV